MARPVQLRYNDAQDGETTIGTYLTDDNLINDGMLKNSGSGEYTRLEITGDIQLQENLPIDYTSFGDAKNGESEPEILVYTYEASSGNFILRDRVFPEDAGMIKDKGTYRNDNLWGFQKWVGRKRVTGVSLSNATITEIVDDLLPSGYTAVTPAGDSVPTVDNYSYTGNINGALRDIIRDYPVKIWFTANLDGNNDYEVKVQSKGFGSVIQTVTFDDERQTEGYSINSFQPEDKSNIVNKVEIIGKASDGTKIQEIVDDQTSISNHGERYIKRNVGYVQDSSQATSLANSILSPDPSPHAEMSIPFQEDNQLNGSVDILDNRYGIDAVYTIVKQRDFFTEGRTEVELGFEKNRTEKRRNTTRDLDERNNQLFTTTTKGLTGQTGEDDPDVDGDSDDTSPDVQGDTGDTGPNVNGISDAEAPIIQDSDSEFRSGVTISGSDWTQVSILNTSGNSTLYHAYTIEITDIASSVNWLKVVISDDSEGFGNVIWMDTLSNPGARTFTNGVSNVETTYEKTILLPAGSANSQISDHYLSMTASGGVDVDFNFEVAEVTHDHAAGTFDADLHPHDDGTLDAVLHPHGDGTYGVVLHPHDAGSLEAEVSEEDKTDR